MESKHTKGEWRVEPSANEVDFLIRSSEGKTILMTCEDGIGGKYRNKEEAESNAKLCAAAPELLEALQGLCKTMKPYIIILGVKKGFSELVALAAAEKAIKKASE